MTTSALASFLTCSILLTGLVSSPLQAIGLDSDKDGVDDSIDNCTLIPNDTQRDTDNDGYGNLCDPDLNNDEKVDFADLSALKKAFFTSDPDADLDGSGSVDFADLALLKGMFFSQPGPAGAGAGDVASLAITSSTSYVRMTEGQNRSVIYTPEVNNLSPSPLILNITELTPATGLSVDSNNTSPIQVLPGSGSFAFTQNITGLIPGEYQLTVLAGVAGTSAYQELVVKVQIDPDADLDTIADGLDFCPDTAPAANVDEWGCSSSQDIASSGQLRRIEINPTDAALPITMLALASNVDDRLISECVLEVNGDVILETPLGNIPVFETGLLFECDAGGGSLAIRRVRGSAQVPFPDVGFLAGAQIENPVQAELGLDTGANLAFLEAPLNEARHYLFFRFFGGFSASAGPISFATPFNKEAVIVLDPTDPFFYMRGDLPGLDIAGVEDVGIGLSLKGLIPFAPDYTYAIANEVSPFTGALYIQGSVSFDKLRIPLQIVGESTWDIDPDDDGQTIFQDINNGFQVGVNGDLNVNVDFLRFFSFGFPVGGASVGLQITDSTQEAYFAGLIDPVSGLLTPDLQQIVPIRPSADVQIAGLLSASNDDKSFVQAEGTFNLDMSNLSSLVGVSLDDLADIDAFMRVDKDGFLLNGDAVASIHPAIDFGGIAAVDALFSGDPDIWYLIMSGNLDVLGIPLLNGALDVSSSGLFVNGAYETPLNRIAMNGEISTAGVSMGGETGVTIPVDSIITVIEQITSGLICGYDVVTDAVICGVNTVTDAAICGTELVTSAAICGVDTVTSAAICGYNVVTSAAICGVDTVTSAAICGTSIVVDVVECAGGYAAYAACLVNPFDSNCSKYITCSVANTCSVARSCNVAATCDAPRTCAIASTCDAPRSCQIEATCDQEVEIPNPIGSFSGNIALNLSTSTGLTGSVAGEYCPVSGSCQTLLDGIVNLGPNPEACITAPAGLGQFCVPF